MPHFVVTVHLWAVLKVGWVLLVSHKLAHTTMLVDPMANAVRSCVLSEILMGHLVKGNCNDVQY